MITDSRTQSLPVVALLLAATMWGVMWYPLRLLDAQGMNGLWATLVSFGAAMVVGLAWIRGGIEQWMRAPGLVAVMALATGWCNLAFVLAVLDGTVLRVLLLFYLSPVWTVLLGHFLLGEHLTVRSFVVLLVALVGALVMLWSPETASPWPQSTSDWLALSSGFAFSVSNVLIRKLQQVSVAAKTAASWVGAVLISAIAVAVLGSGVPDSAWPVWGGAVALGVFGLVIMTLSVQYGVSRLPVHRSAVILLFELVAGSVSSMWLAHEFMSGREWVGGIMIMVAAWLSATPEQTT